MKNHQKTTFALFFEKNSIIFFKNKLINFTHFNIFWESFATSLSHPILILALSLLPCSRQFKKWKCTEVFMHGKTLNQVIGPALSCTSSGPIIPEKPTASGFSYKRTFGYPMLQDLVPMCASLTNNKKLNNPVNILYSSNLRVQTCSGSLIIFSLCGDDNLNESCTFRILCELPLLNWNILRSSRIIGELA